MKFHLITLGCSKNTADSEFIANKFNQNGWQWTDKPETADLLLVNTCGFIKDAKEESLRMIVQALSLKSLNKQQKTLVFGCLVKRYHKEIEQGIPEIDFLFEFLSDEDFDKIFSAFKSKKIGKNTTVVSRFFSPKHIGILKIAEGCSNRCAYCAIPSIRGPFISRNEKEILKDAKSLAQSGAKELSVVAQDITRYGTDISGKCELPKLVKKLAKIDGIEWIRLHYMHPRGLTTDLLDELYNTPKVLPYFDIPFQHISDRMLRLMKRHTSPEHIKNLIKYIRKNFRNSAIRTTFIVGFPGENEEDFQELIAFLDEYPLDRVGAFIYSTEENTSAAKIIPKIAQAEKQRRLDELMTLQQMIIEEQNQMLIGKKTEVIIDSVEKTTAFARTIWDAYEVDNETTVNKADSLKPGDIVKVKIINANAYDFKAELV